MLRRKRPGEWSVGHSLTGRRWHPSISPTTLADLKCVLSTPLTLLPTVRQHERRRLLLRSQARCKEKRPHAEWADILMTRAYPLPRATQASQPYSTPLPPLRDLEP